MIFAEAYPRPLILLHALLAMALTGAATHQGVVAWLRWRGRPRPRLERIYAWAVTLLSAATMAAGAAAYPAYRYYVRALWLDHHAPAVANLFDIKENFAVIGLALAAVTVAVAGGRERAPSTPHAARTYVLCAVVIAVIVWFNTVSGLYITMIRPV